MSTGSKPPNPYTIQKEALDKIRASVVTSGKSVFVGSQYHKGIQPGELFVLSDFTMDKSSYMRNLDKVRPKKHPNRPIKVARCMMESGMFDHLKKGRMYKIAFPKVHFGSGMSIVRVDGLPLQKKATLLREATIGYVMPGQMVIYLETVRGEHGIHHKVVVNDQVGFISANNNDYKLKRITSRMLRRMGAADDIDPISDPDEP